MTDPAAGFVTGGGYFKSPSGAYWNNKNATGKASFGFTSKYNKGQSIPSGNFMFSFDFVNFTFTSTSYEAMVVIPSDCSKIKGSGKINDDETEYGFMLTPCDFGEPGDLDTLRVKIWDPTLGYVVYDNLLDEVNDVDFLGTSLGGGNIKIHRPKKEKGKPKKNHKNGSKLRA